MLINDNAKISKDTLDYEIININKINCITRNHLNSENDIKFNIEHRIYKGFYNKLIDLEQIFKGDIIVFNKHKTNIDLYKNEL